LRALLLAAGVGTRLRPRTLTVPKCLVRIRGKPLLDYWLEHLFSAGIERALINTHWLADAVRDHVDRSPFRGRIDLVHETTLLGTGGTLLANRDWYGEKPILVAHADNLTNFDVAHFMAAHRHRPVDCSLSMLAFHTDAPQTCGILDVGADGVVVGFHEKVTDPPGNLANGAVYIFEPEITAFICSLGRSVVDLSTEVIPHFVGKIYAVEASGYHRDIGTEESLRLAELECSQGQLNKFR
jgi:mannose-1-phosphate guanylyltransferase